MKKDALTVSFNLIELKNTNNDKEHWLIATYYLSRNVSDTSITSLADIELSRLNYSAKKK